MRALLLARSFAGARSGGRLSAAFGIGVVAISLAVAFVLFAFGIYDNYSARIEALTLGLLPNVSAIQKTRLAGAGDGPTVSECESICDGREVISLESRSRDPGAAMAVEPLKAVLGRDREILAVAPVLWSEVEATVLDARGSGEPRPIRLLGIDTSARPLVPRLDALLTAADLAALKDGRVLISQELVEAWFEGDVPQAIALEVTGHRVNWPVGGAFALGLRGAGDGLVVASMLQVQELVAPEVSPILGLSLADPWNAEAVLARNESHLGQAGLEGRAWTAQAGQDFESLRLLRWIMLVVLSLSFVVTGFSLRNALDITVIERRQEIGVLRALGVQDGTIRSTFVTLALSVGLVGLAVGTPAGWLMSVLFGAWLEQEVASGGLLPVSGVTFAIPWRAVGEVTALVVVTCVGTALVSVQRALSLQTVDCLRTE